ncbi:MAG: EF-P lysine aminoacylase GenX [Gammaproteobacteria bacterium]|jgi:lysyl-tRNA synthetase class 2|nr:EF-P lysine aminoacylase GenX [Gammaproteobacteria bacterium]MBT5053213.1 EF-P lysine aminoacylase GenX [Gammaproteobacteria bacterium]
MPTWPVLKARAKVLAAIRRFFEARSVTEVSTPSLSRSGTFDAQLSSFEVSDQAEKLFLQTSPEYALKRALAVYREAIFEITPAFRRGDQGSQHNPEFTMLEWYRPGLSLSGLMAEVVDLLNALPEPPEIWRAQSKVDLPVYSFRAVFEQRFGVNPNEAALSSLWQWVQETGAEVTHLAPHDDDQFRSDCLDFLFLEVLQPSLGDIFFLTEFPPCQAALAEIDPKTDTAQRFELYWQGTELANGYLELRDPAVILSRHTVMATARINRGLPSIAFDTAFAEASALMPACAGVALGIDRLVMVWLKAKTLSEVQLFSWPNH